MESYHPRSVLITGGAGFIGSNFVRYLLTHVPSIRIINLDKLTYAGSLQNLANLPNEDQHHFITGDINDVKLLRHILQHHHIDTIVHFAAESHVDRSIASPQQFVETNVLGTFNLLEAARHHWFEVEGCLPTECRFHHVSTDEVYGALQLQDKAFTETTPYQPRSPYSATKAGSDHLVMAYHHTFGLPVTLSNCSNNFGPYQHTEKFIPTVIRACMQSQPIPVYGKGENIRDWLYVEDHCRGIHAILQKGRVGEQYNMGGNKELTNLQVVEQICDIFDGLKPRNKSHRELLQFVTDRPGHDFRYAIDNSKITAELDWQPAEDFAQRLAQTINFYAKSL